MDGVNRLAEESSPYLRQHADNPVHWWPWGPGAMAEAAERDVPILLSVGYSACHWCHVMAHESFEDDSCAAVMNEHFVNVKVDREERPDVDAIYMDAVQAMTGRGGWPMTVFLTPDGRPFYGGTYFPPRRHGQVPSFVELLHAVHEAWSGARGQLFEQADRLTEALGQAGRMVAGNDVPGPEALDAAVDHLRQAFDPDWGGFGGAPKFPTPQNLDLALRQLARTGDPDLRTLAETTLDAMASGGMYDHLGGGFARYSVDPHWVVPHFEKMLYDQSGLLRLYLHGHLVTGHQRYAQVVEEMVAYVLRDLRQPGGGIASAEDADSLDEHGHSEEGAFYTFTADEVRAALEGAGIGDTVDDALAWWELDRPANFEGRWIPVRTHHRGDWSRPDPIDRARTALFEARATRPRPGLDDKVLTEWNAHWVAALAEAGFALERPDWVDAAVETAEFLLASLRRDDGRWLRSWQAETGAKHLAFAGDHAALVDALTRLAEATGEARWLTEARAVADAMLELFWDHDHGGLFTTGTDGEQLVTRDKDLQDQALPSANSTAAVALLRLAALSGEARHRDAATSILRLGGDLAARVPSAFGVLLSAVDLHGNGTTEVVVTGDRPDLVDVLRHRWLPNGVFAWGERTDSPLWAERPDGQAYVCQGHACRMPASSPEELTAQLD